MNIFYLCLRYIEVLVLKFKVLVISFGFVKKNVNFVFLLSLVFICILFIIFIVDINLLKVIVKLSIYL